MEAARAAIVDVSRASSTLPISMAPERKSVRTARASQRFDVLFENGGSDDVASIAQALTASRK